MKLIAPRAAWLATLSQCATVAENRGTTPMASHVLVDCRNGAALLSATDGVAALRCTLAGKVERQGYFGLSAKGLLERVRSMPDADITVDVKDEANAVIRATGSNRRHTLRVVHGCDFPMFPLPGDGPTLTVDAAALAWVLHRVEHAASLDAARHIHSILLTSVDGWLRADATDGHCSASADVRVDGLAGGASALIGLKSAGVLAKLCDADGGEEAALTLNRSRLLLRCGTVECVTLLVDGSLPPLRETVEMVPESTHVDVPRALMIDAVKSVAIASGDKVRSVVLHVDGDALKLSSRGESSDAEDTVPVTSNGPPVRVAFSVELLTSALNALDCVTARLSFGDGKVSPLKLRRVDSPESERVIQMLMPMVL